MAAHHDAPMSEEEALKFVERQTENDLTEFMTAVLTSKSPIVGFQPNGTTASVLIRHHEPYSTATLGYKVKNGEFHLDSPAKNAEPDGCMMLNDLTFSGDGHDFSLAKVLMNDKARVKISTMVNNWYAAVKAVKEEWATILEQSVESGVDYAV